MRPEARDDGIRLPRRTWRRRSVVRPGQILPRPALAEPLAGLAARSAAFLVGGLSSARTAPLQIAGRVVEGGLSGVLLAGEIGVATGLTQGCSPIGPAHRITEAADNVIMALDGRPALDVFREDIGELLSRDLRRVAGLIFAGMPVLGSDTGDYLVRNLVAIDVEHKWLAVAHELAIGDRVLFLRPDAPSAIADLKRMLAGLKKRAAPPIKAALYYSFVGRLPSPFGDNSEELGLGPEPPPQLPLLPFFRHLPISHPPPTC